MQKMADPTGPEKRQSAYRHGGRDNHDIGKNIFTMMWKQTALE
jgi:hypothetical protein